MTSSGMHKPPVAPKPKLVQLQISGASPATPRRDGPMLPSPSTPGRVKPVLAPKPCLSKLTTAVESKPLASKSLHQISVTENSLTVYLLNSQNGIQRENKKPDWDYIIPICLCSQENCQCIRSTSANKDNMEKDLKTLTKDTTEDKRKLLHTSRDTEDYSDGRTDDTKNHVKSSSPPQNVCPQPASTNTHLTDHKTLQETITLDKNLNTNISTSSPVVTPRPFPPHRTWSDEANGNIIPKSAPEEDALGSERMSGESQPKPAHKNPVPIPRKPRTAVLAHQKKVEEEKRGETVSQERKEMNINKEEVSSEGKGSSSMSVSVPVSENKQPAFLSARKACPPPAPPPRKKPFLSAPENVPTFAPRVFANDVEEEDLGMDSDIYEKEISVDQDSRVEKKGRDDQETVCSNLTHCLPSSSLLTQPPGISAATENNRAVKVDPKKPHQHSSPIWIQRKESKEKEEGKLGDGEKRHVLPLQDCAVKEGLQRELPLHTDEKTSRNLITVGNKSSQSTLGKQKARSFSGADVVRFEQDRRNSFRKLLELKLSVKNPIVKGGQSPDSTANDDEQSVDRDQDKCQNFPAHLRERKFSCPLIGVEQSVDEDEFSHGIEQSGHNESIGIYEEIDYLNVHVGKAESSMTCHGEMYCDEGIYEEPEPFMSLEKTNRQQQHQTPAAGGCSTNEEVAPQGYSHSDDDTRANTSDEEEDDCIFMSSKGDPEQPGQSTTQNGNKTKIHHIATEIMTSESVFVDVLKLLHVDFRDLVSKASRQSGSPVIEERLLNQILYYLPQLYELNHDLLRELKQRVAQWDDNVQLADIFLKKGPFLKMYSTYIREFDKNVALLEEQSKRNPAFGAVVRQFEASPRCANLALKHYLLKPVQRIPQYQLLLTDYLKNLSEDSADYKDTQAALALVKEVANHANDFMKQGDNFQKLIQVQCSLNGNHEIVQPGRIFLKEGLLLKLSRKIVQPRMLFLFNDALLYTTPLQSGQYKLNKMLSLAGMKVSKPSLEAYQNELNIESVERSFILFASSAIERDEWLQAISLAISDYAKRKISFIPGKPSEKVDQMDGASLGSKAPIWIPDLRTTMCMICFSDFTLTWRRHHCRACGKVVCQDCSSNKHCLEYLKNHLARVCDDCFVILQQQNESSSPAAPALGNKSAFSFVKKHKKIPAALKEVCANTDNSSMSGYLQRSKVNKKLGKRLWFVIKNKVLYTYAASEDVAALESQPLLGFVLKADPSQKLQFELYHQNTLYYIFKADDVQTAQRWINSFKEATVL
uniref:FYVE, RhoGEF and PH domain-containing protein 6-like n=1 Tax=Monopterus albus TaxID=43700 RepID=UPI0009B3346C|nr:FYVE, RhoGEF and PH domain-containing protein 6-like [Monopterus albus]